MDSEWVAPASGPVLWADRSLAEKSNRHPDQPNSSLISKYDTMGPCGRFILWTSHLHVHMSTLEPKSKEVMLSCQLSCCQPVTTVYNSMLLYGPLNVGVHSSSHRPAARGMSPCQLTEHIGSWVCSFSSLLAWSHALCLRIRYLKGSNALLPS